MRNINEKLEIPGNWTRAVKPVSRCYTGAIPTMYPPFTSLLSPNFTSLIYFPNPLSEYIWADCLQNVGAWTSHNPLGLYGLLQG
jgi:hypothetical protein